MAKRLMAIERAEIARGSTIKLRDPSGSSLLKTYSQKHSVFMPQFSGKYKPPPAGSAAWHTGPMRSLIANSKFPKLQHTVLLRFLARFGFARASTDQREKGQFRAVTMGLKRVAGVSSIPAFRFTNPIVYEDKQIVFAGGNIQRSMKTDCAAWGAYH
jgi:hypothetical protein